MRTDRAKPEIDLRCAVSLLHLLRQEVAAGLADEPRPILRGPLGQALDKSLDLLALRLTEVFDLAELGRVALARFRSGVLLWARSNST